MFKNLFYRLIFKKIIETKKCDFCDCNERRDNPFIVGDNSSICANCVLSAYTIIFGYIEPSSAKKVWDDEYDDIDFLDSIRNKKIEGEL